MLDCFSYHQQSWWLSRGGSTEQSNSGGVSADKATNMACNNALDADCQPNFLLDLYQVLYVLTHRTYNSTYNFRMDRFSFCCLLAWICAVHPHVTSIFETNNFAEVNRRGFIHHTIDCLLILYIKFFSAAQ